MVRKCIGTAHFKNVCKINFYLNTSNRISSRITGPISTLSSNETSILYGFRSCESSSHTSLRRYFIASTSMSFEYISKYVMESSLVSVATCVFFFKIDVLTSVPNSQANRRLQFKNEIYNNYKRFFENYHIVSFLTCLNSYLFAI